MIMAPMIAGALLAIRPSRRNDRAQPQHQEEPVRGDRIAIHLCVQFLGGNRAFQIRLPAAGDLPYQAFAADIDQPIDSLNRHFPDNLQVR